MPLSFEFHDQEVTRRDQRIAALEAEAARLREAIASRDDAIHAAAREIAETRDEAKRLRRVLNNLVAALDAETALDDDRFLWLWPPLSEARLALAASTPHDLLNNRSWDDAQGYDGR